MDIDGNVDIFNEHKGVWDGGIWYSNTTYKPAVVYTKPSYYSYAWESCDFCDKWSPKIERFMTDGFAYNLCPVCKADFDLLDIPMKGAI